MSDKEKLKQETFKLFGLLEYDTFDYIYDRAFEQGERTHAHSSDCETCKEMQEQAFEQGRKEEQFKIREEVRVRAAEQNYVLAQSGIHKIATELLQLLEWLDSQSLEKHVSCGDCGIELEPLDDDKIGTVVLCKECLDKQTISQSLDTRKDFPDERVVSSSRDTSLEVPLFISRTPEYILGIENGRASERAKIEKMIEERIKELKGSAFIQIEVPATRKIIKEELNSLLENIKKSALTSNDNFLEPSSKKDSGIKGMKP